MLPGDYAANADLENDIATLFENDGNLSDYAHASASFNAYHIFPAILHGAEDGIALLCKHKHKNKHKHKHHHRHKRNVFAQVKHFIQKHKKAIIIGSVILAATIVIVVAVTAASSAGAVTAAGAAAGAAAAPNSVCKSDTKDKQENFPSASIPADIPPGMIASHEPLALKSTIDHQIVFFKESIVQSQFFQPTTQNESLSLEENGRTLGSLFAHNSYNNLQHQLPYHSRFSQEIQGVNSNHTFFVPEVSQSAVIGHSEIDRKFSTEYSYLYLNPSQEVDFNTLSHQIRGERALSSGYYNQAIEDLGKAIETNPTNPIPYLERGIAHFSLGQFERSLEDYEQFISQSQAQKPNSLSVSEFSLGFAKGLPKGVYESGEGLFLFLTDFVKHPINTSTQIVDSVATLVNLVRNDEWGMVAEALSPEVHQLVTEWDTLPSEKKGELAGYAVGKHGADVLVPGALAKVANMSVKSAQELAVVCKNLQIAQETLVLETAAEIGNSAKLAEVVRNGQTMLALGEDVGLTVHEMAQLKQAGKLEGTINNGLEKLVSQSESEVLKTAISQNKHVNMVRDYLDKPAQEIQKGINSYEKQIAIHKDKISIPTKYYPDWDKLDPRQREALINKKWPAEIKGYEEQRTVLQSILNERLSYER